MTPSPALHDLLGAITGRLVVSCQAPDGHALRDSDTIARLAQAAAAGGAAAIRCGGVGGVRDVETVVAAVDLPVVGLTKDGTEDVFITPTVTAATGVVRAGATVVALDGTRRPRPDGAPLADSIAAVHSAGGLVMADVATTAEGVAAAGVGADLVATTLSGYTPETRHVVGADIDLVGSLRAALPDVPIIAEGRYHTPELAAAALRAGATSVVAGTAITDPTWITRSFTTVMSQ